MKNESAQPFSKDKQKSTDDAALVGQVSGPRAEAEMRELVGDTKSQTTPVTGIELSDAEQSATCEAEKNLSEKQRGEYILWAEAHKRTKEWVDDTFEFVSDGSVIAEDALDFFGERIKFFPKGLVESRMYVDLADNRIDSLKDFNLPPTVMGFLGLAGNQLTTLEGMPTEVVGAVFLEDNQLDSLDGLPKKITGSLDLRNNPATSIPAGLDIGGPVVLTSRQDGLAADASLKGYDVVIK